MSRYEIGNFVSPFWAAFVSNSYRDTKWRYESSLGSKEMLQLQALFTSYRDTERP
jgi:hypothetical protein